MENTVRTESRFVIGGGRADKKYFAVMMAFSVVVYFLLISQRLTNTYDGLWNDTFAIGGWWEVTIGRWLWPVADALRFGVQTDPINSLLTLSCVSVALVVVRRLFVKKDSLLTYLAGMSFLAGAAVSIQLSYRFMSPIFGFSFLFSVIAALCVIRSQTIGKSIVLGAVWLALSLGLYQANLSCFCLILLVYFLMLLFSEKEQKQVRAHIVKSLGSAAAGMILYYLVLKIILQATGWQMAGYNGASQVSPLYILQNLPDGILKAYQIFAVYFFKNEYRSNVLQAFGFYILLFCVVGAGLLFRFWKLIRSRNVEYALLTAATLTVLPLACNMMILITYEAEWRLQMAGGLDLFVPLCFLLLEATRSEWQENKSAQSVVCGGILALAVLTVYGNVYMRAIDQEAMCEGTKTLKVMSDRIADDLTNFGYFDSEKQLPVVFVGRPSSNPNFLMREYYLYANSYAQMGRFWLGGDCARSEWRGVFRNITPINFRNGTVKEYYELYNADETERMPVYPRKGYIQQIGDVIVVKVSEDYKIGEDEGPLTDFQGMIETYQRMAN